MPAPTSTFRWTRSDLSEPRRQLLDLMRRLQFGSIEALPISNKEPELDRARIRRDIKLGSNTIPPACDSEQFELKRQVVELFEQLEALGNGTVEALEVRHGLPFRLVLRQST